MFFSIVPVALAALATQSSATLLSDYSQLKSSYDFIIIGGGTSGLVVANRLTENADFNVLVLEAGDSDADIVNVEVPYLCPYLAKGTPYDWNFTTVAQTGLQGRSIDYPFGHLLGGSSSVNHFTYNRGSSEDWDRYAELTGDDGWTWDNMESYFLKNEDLTPPQDGRDTSGEIDPSQHGTDGMTDDSLPGYLTPLSPRIMSTTDQLAEFPFNLDMNSGSPLGVGWLPSTISDGARVSSSNSYLGPEYISRTNLDVILNTRVTRILATSTDPTPMLNSVEFSGSEDGPVYVLNATKEVILSAGAILSPHILVHSGVGPASTLSALGISTVVENPSVGQNLTDQALLPVGWSVTNPNTYDNFVRNETLAAATLQEWMDDRTGPYTTSAGITHLSFSRIPDNATIWADFEDPSAGPASPHYEFLFFNQILADLFATPDSTANYMSIVVSGLNPLSRGEISWTSSNPWVMPDINPNVLDSEYDLWVIREGIRAARRFVEAPAWDDYVIYAASTNATSDADLNDYIQSNAMTLYQTAATLSMTKSDADYGVVNPDFSVKGTRGLRVVDSSVIPLIPAGHIQVAVYVFAERAADMIKASWA